MAGSWLGKKTMTSKVDELNLIWIDLEMTGLDTVNDKIIEIATLITDKDLNILAEGPQLAIYQTEDTLEAMDEWNKSHHAGTGLIQRIRDNGLTQMEAEHETLEFLRQWVPPQKSPICGNSICQDRRFLATGMPELEGFFHYRNLDVSSVKELISRWRPDLLGGFKKRNIHRAMDDIYDSIAELAYYRQHFFVMN
jgi:oligoribonuclease